MLFDSAGISTDAQTRNRFAAHARLGNLELFLWSISPLNARACSMRCALCCLHSAVLAMNACLLTRA